jgi:hypothetical protein
MVVRKCSAVVLLLLMVGGLHACGEPRETCTCTCTCGSGAKTTLDDATSDDDCANRCRDDCGNDSFTTNYDCTTEG